MKSKHGKTLRGLTTDAVNGNPPAKPPTWTARFGRMFPDLPGANYGNDQETLDRLGKLADAMIAPFDPPRDDADEEESGIPALYTYFCFV